MMHLLFLTLFLTQSHPSIAFSFFGYGTEIYENAALKH